MPASRRSWHSAQLVEHTRHGGMRPVLHLDPMLRPAALIGRSRRFETKPSSPNSHALRNRSGPISPCSYSGKDESSRRASSRAKFVLRIDGGGLNPRHLVKHLLHIEVAQLIGVMPFEGVQLAGQRSRRARWRSARHGRGACPRQCARRRGWQFDWFDGHGTNIGGRAAKIRPSLVTSTAPSFWGNIA